MRLWEFETPAFHGLGCSSACSVDDGALARIRIFDVDLEYHFIEDEKDTATMALKREASKTLAGHPKHHR